MAVYVESRFVSADDLRRQPDEDRPLVDRARAGESEAFEALVERHQHRVVSFARGLVRGSQADAEDVAQEAFVRAWRSLRQFRGASAFRTWLLQIVTNVARTHRTRRLARPEVAVDPNVSEALASAVGGDRVEAALVAHDQVVRALATLSDEMREVVLLRDREGLDYREIADVLKIPIGTVESRLFRGRARLRAALTDEMPTDNERGSR